MYMVFINFHGKNLKIRYLLRISEGGKNMLPYCRKTFSSIFCRENDMIFEICLGMTVSRVVLIHFRDANFPSKTP